MKRSFIASSVMVMLLMAATITFIAPSADAEGEDYGVGVFHDNGNPYTETDRMINGGIQVNNLNGTFLIPADTVIPTDPSYVKVHYSIDRECCIGFAVTGAQQFLQHTKVKAELYSDKERTSLLGTSVANLTEDLVFFQTDGEKIEFQRDTNYYIVLKTAEYYEMTDVPRDPSVSIIFGAETEGVHELSYDSNGGTPASIPSVFLSEGTPYGELPTVTKEGSTFAGWYDGDTKVSAETVMGTEDVELKAHWTTVPTHTVTFDSNGGTPSSIPSRNVTEGDKLGTLPTVIKSGYTFEGWFSGTTRYTSESIMGTEDIALKASWSRNPTPPGPTPPGPTPPEPEHKETMEFDPSTGYSTKTVTDTLTTTDSSTGYTTVEVTGTETVTSPVGEVKKVTEFTSTTVTDPLGETVSEEYHSETVDDTGETQMIIITDRSSERLEDGGTDVILHSTTKGSDGSVLTENSYTVSDADGKIVGFESMRVSRDAEDKITSASFDALDLVGKANVTTRYDMTSREVSAKITNTGAVDSDMAGALKGQLDSVDAFLLENGLEASYSITFEIADGIALDADAVSMLAKEGYGLYIIAETGSMLLDDDVISSAALAMEDVTITMEKGTEDNLTPEQMRIVGDGFAVVVKMFRGSVQVHDIGGTATISLEPGLKENVFIYYIQEDGSYELIKSSYDQKTGEVSFTVTHFSVYLATAEDIDSKDSGFPWWIVAVIAIIVCVVLLITFFIHRRSRFETQN